MAAARPPFSLEQQRDEMLKAIALKSREGASIPLSDLFLPVGPAVRPLAAALIAHLDTSDTSLWPFVIEIATTKPLSQKILQRLVDTYLLPSIDINDPDNKLLYPPLYSFIFPDTIDTLSVKSKEGTLQMQDFHEIVGVALDHLSAPNLDENIRLIAQKKHDNEWAEAVAKQINDIVADEKVQKLVEKNLGEQQALAVLRQSLKDAKQPLTAEWAVDLLATVDRQERKIHSTFSTSFLEERLTKVLKDQQNIIEVNTKVYGSSQIYTLKWDNVDIDKAQMEKLVQVIQSELARRLKKQTKGEKNNFTKLNAIVQLVALLDEISKNKHPDPLLALIRGANRILSTEHLVTPGQFGKDINAAIEPLRKQFSDKNTKASKGGMFAGKADAKDQKGFGLGAAAQAAASQPPQAAGPSPTKPGGGKK